MKKKEMSIVNSSAAEYLTYISSICDQKQGVEVIYEDENIWLTQ